MNKENIELVAKSGKTEFERADMLMRSMSKLSIAMLDYKYAYDNYEGNREEILKDRTMAIKNAMAVVLSDAEIYMYLLGITELTKQKASGRIDKVANAIMRNE